MIRGAAAVGTVGLILEHSIHTNTRITHWLMDETNLARLAEEEAVLIAEYFDVLGKRLMMGLICYIVFRPAHSASEATPRHI